MATLPRRPGEPITSEPELGEPQIGEPAIGEPVTDVIGERMAGEPIIAAPSISEKIVGEQVNWPPPLPISDWVMPGWGITIGRGIAGKCPHCGQAPIFDGYLKVHETCAACVAPLGQMPADDTPPYIAMLVVAHFVGLALVLNYRWHLHPGGIEIGCLLALLVLLCLVALRLAKGAVIGILLKLDNNREKPSE